LLLFRDNIAARSDQSTTAGQLTHGRFLHPEPRRSSEISAESVTLATSSTELSLHPLRSHDMDNNDNIELDLPSIGVDDDDDEEDETTDCLANLRVTENLSLLGPETHSSPTVVS